MKHINTINKFIFNLYPDWAPTLAQSNISHSLRLVGNSPKTVKKDNTRITNSDSVLRTKLSKHNNLLPGDIQKFLKSKNRIVRRLTLALIVLSINRIQAIKNSEIQQDLIEIYRKIKFARRFIFFNLLETDSLVSKEDITEFLPYHKIKPQQNNLSDNLDTELTNTNILNWLPLNRFPNGGVYSTNACSLLTIIYKNNYDLLPDLSVNLIYVQYETSFEAEAISFIEEEISNIPEKKSSYDITPGIVLKPSAFKVQGEKSLFVRVKKSKSKYQGSPLTDSFSIDDSNSELQVGKKKYFHTKVRTPGSLKQKLNPDHLFNKCFSPKMQLFRPLTPSIHRNRRKLQIRNAENNLVGHDLFVKYSNNNSSKGNFSRINRRSTTNKKIKLSKNTSFPPKTYQVQVSRRGLSLPQARKNQIHTSKVTYKLDKRSKSIRESLLKSITKSSQFKNIPKKSNFPENQPNNSTSALRPPHVHTTKADYILSNFNTATGATLHKSSGNTESPESQKSRQFIVKSPQSVHKLRTRTISRRHHTPLTSAKKQKTCDKLQISSK